MTTIKEMQGFQQGDSVNRTQVRVVKVYEREPFAGRDGPTHKQNAIIGDASGATIRLTVWGHDDISMYEGKEVIIEGKNGKGVTIRVYKEKAELSVSKTGTINPLEVYNAHNPTAPLPASADAPKSAPRPAAPAAVPSAGVHGAKVGMAINNAVLLMTEQKIPYSTGSLYGLAKEIIEVSTALENGTALGNVGPAKVETPKAAAPTPATPPAGNREGADQDVPF